MIIGHLPALEVGSLPLLSTRPERMSEKAQFYGRDRGEVCTQGRRGVRRRGVRRRGVRCEEKRCEEKGCEV